MAYALLLAFVAVPIIEIAIFIQVGGLIGLFPTLLIVLATAVAGTALLRSQGFRALQSARTTLDRGGFPARELFDGACILIGGVLLLTPGFFTDALGLLLLLPPVREMLRAYAMRHVTLRPGPGMTGGFGDDGGGGPESGPFGGTPGGSPWGRGAGGSRDGRTGPIIEGEFDEVDPREPPRRPDDDAPRRDLPDR